MEIDILWVFQSSRTLLSEILGSSNKYTITEGITRPSVDSSQIRVDFLNDGDAGRYACQIQFRNNGTLAPASQALQLDMAEVFRAQSLPPCSTSLGLVEEEETCAIEEFTSIGAGVPLFPAESNPNPRPPSSGTESNGNDGGDNGSIVVWIILGSVTLFVVLVLILCTSVIFLYNCICQ